MKKKFRVYEELISLEEAGHKICKECGAMRSLDENPREWVTTDTSMTIYAPIESERNPITSSTCQRNVLEGKCGLAKLAREAEKY